MGRRHAQSGFTLVEVIVSVLTAVVLGLVMYAYVSHQRRL
jgi:Tfp pilus assembly protein PilE